MKRDVDVIVVGGGHAGSEAAVAAARMGASVLLVTANLETIGQMSCNPAIGGVAKGTVVREVDALGGVMGRAADLATIQFRMLNRSKGPAVWSPRAQADRGLYRRAVRSLVEAHHGVRCLQGTVARLVFSGDRVAGIETESGQTFSCGAVVLTAGTFLRGRIHMGPEGHVSGGRAGDRASIDLAEQMEATGLSVARFKTGTPPRVDGRSVDYTRLERQDGEDPDYRFSRFVRTTRPEQLPCWITQAGREVKDIITAHLHESALYGGEIAGRGPRYCPSIEDKVVKFPDAEHHQIFLEPEGLDTAELYVNGVSTSLPIDVQQRFLEAIPGLESVRMTRPGYAIEYDYYPPDQLHPWLEVKSTRGLFFAGQINGTTGYEEAAGQGVLAGLNAGLRIRGDSPFTLERSQAYVGVLVDDLVTRGVDEPYRLFTSRAEYRLLLRQDNALGRLAPLMIERAGFTEDEKRRVEEQVAEEEEVIQLARERNVTPEQVNQYLEDLGEASIPEPIRIAQVVRRPPADLQELFARAGITPSVSAEVWVTAGIQLKYDGYIRREAQAAERMKEMTSFSLSPDLPYEQMHSLSTEARQKLGAIRPLSLAQAARIPGISPSDLQNLVGEVVRRKSAVA